MSDSQYDITQFSMADMVRCGAVIRSLTQSCDDMEAAANVLTRYLQTSFRGTGGKQIFSLVRLFVSLPWGDVHPMIDLKREQPGRQGIDAATKCLTLLATAGQLPEWNDRRCSIGHQAIPLTSAETIKRIPMIANMLRQFGVTVSEVLEPSPQFLVDTSRHTFQVFHVAETMGSPCIPSQEEFVRPYGIHSCLGLGGMLATGSFFAAILFSNVPISEQTAAMFRPLSMSIRAALIPLTTVFSPS